MRHVFLCLLPLTSDIWVSVRFFFLSSFFLLSSFFFSHSESCFKIDIFVGKTVVLGEAWEGREEQMQKMKK